MLVYETIAICFSNLLRMFFGTFNGQLRVHHVGGAVIPPFRAPLVTKLYKLIRLSIKNLLNFIVIQ